MLRYLIYRYIVVIIIEEDPTASYENLKLNYLV